MINKKAFEIWRKSHVLPPDVAAIMHYHRCSDAVYFDVRAFLTTLLHAGVTKCRRSVKISLTADFLNSVLQFVNEMDISYIHPRSTSARYHFNQIQTV